MLHMLFGLLLLKAHIQSLLPAATIWPSQAFQKEKKKN
jgi:hypothetical protein